MSPEPQPPRTYILSGEKPTEPGIRREVPGMMSVWTPVDTSESGPSTDFVPAMVKAYREDDVVRLHITSHHGDLLWTISVDLTDVAAAELSFNLQIALPPADPDEEDENDG